MREENIEAGMQWGDSVVGRESHTHAAEVEQASGEVFLTNGLALGKSHIA